MLFTLRYKVRIIGQIRVFLAFLGQICALTWKRAETPAAISTHKYNYSEMDRAAVLHRKRRQQL